MVDYIQIVIAKYLNSDLAEAALKKLDASKENQGVDIRDAAVVRRGDNGKLHIHETEDVTGTRGATVGGILGAVLGLIAGPAGVVAGAAVGAAVGGVTARAIDTGIPHKRLKEIGATLESGHAALVILTDAGFVDFIKSVIGGSDVEIHQELMNAGAAAQMGHEHDVAIKALTLGDALADGGVASPADETSDKAS